MKASRSVKKDLDVGVEKLGAVVLWRKTQEQALGTQRCESLGTIRLEELGLGPNGRTWGGERELDLTC